MRRVVRAGAALFIIVVTGLAACGDGTSPKITPVTVDTLLLELTETQAFGSAGMVFGGSPAAFGAKPDKSCAFESATQRFECEPVTIKGLTTNRYYQLLDASGAAQSAFNPLTTAAFRSVTDVEGTIEVDIPTERVQAAAFSVTVDSHDDQTLSGLLSGVHTLNGTGSSTTDYQSAPFLDTVESTWTNTNLVLPKRGASQKYPQSGSMAFTVAVASGFDLSITITFDGTSTAKMTIVAGGQTQTCDVNLAKPDSLPTCLTG